MKNIYKKYFLLFLWFVAGLIVLTNLIFYTLDQFYLIDLFINFKLYLIYGTFLFAIIAIFFSKYLFLVVSIVLLLNTLEIVKYYPKKNKKVVEKDYSLLYANLHYRNKKHHQFINLVNKKNPDIIAVVEYTTEWDKAFVKNITNYYVAKKVKKNPFGLAILSKYEILEKKIYLEDTYPILLIKVKIAKKDVFILAAHPPPPITKNYYQIRNNTFEKLAEIIPKYDNLILAADLNVTQWSYYYKKLMQNSKLQTKLSCIPFNNTWRSGLPLLKIDYIMTSSSLDLFQVRILENINSDHLPLYLEGEIRKDN